MSADESSPDGCVGPSTHSITAPRPSTSSSTVVRGSTASALNAAHVERRKQRKKLAIKKLEKKLENYNRHIKKFNEEPISLEDMKSGNSAYLKEDYVKRKFMATWEELCRLINIPSTIEVTHEDGMDDSYSGTSYPEVNRRVRRLLKSDEFPDHMDICELIDRSNVKHSLGIGAQEKAEMSRKVFKEVGEIIKSRRIKDYRHHFGSHLTDSIKVLSDPADDDDALLQQLKTNLEEGRGKMEHLVEEFVVKEETEVDKGGSGSTPGDSCNSHEEEEEEEEDKVLVLDEEIQGNDSDLSDHETGSPARKKTRIEASPSPDNQSENGVTEDSNSGAEGGGGVRGVAEGGGEEEAPSSTTPTNIIVSDSDSDVIIISDDEDT